MYLFLWRERFLSNRFGVSDCERISGILKQMELIFPDLIWILLPPSSSFWEKTLALYEELVLWGRYCNGEKEENLR